VCVLSRRKIVDYLATNVLSSWDWNTYLCWCFRSWLLIPDKCVWIPVFSNQQIARTIHKLPMCTYYVRCIYTCICLLSRFVTYIHFLFIYWVIFVMYIYLELMKDVCWRMRYWLMLFVVCIWRWCCHIMWCLFITLCLFSTMCFFITWFLFITWYFF